MKIVIIGHSAAGKSTLAKVLSKHYKIALLHMDTLKYYGDFKERDIKSQEALSKEFFDKHDSWITEGNYFHIAIERFKEADVLLFLDLNRLVCLYYALRRYFKNRGKYRESLGAKEHFDYDFLKWILFEGRKKDYLLKLETIYRDFKGEKQRLKSHRAIDRYLKKLGIS